MRRLLLLLLLLTLLLPATLQAQGQLIAGNRTMAGTFNAGLSTGTSTAYVLTLSPALPGYVVDMFVAFRAHTTNAGPATLNVSGLGAIPIRKWVSGALLDLSGGDLHAGQEILLYYDGLTFQVVGSGGGAASVGGIGVLQAAGGGGDLAAYTGNRCTTPGTFAVGQSPTGTFQCEPPTLVVTAAPLLTQGSAQIPNGVNLATQPSGVLQTTVSGSVATVSTRPAPVGKLLGDIDVQEVTNTRVTPRRASLPTDVTPLVIDSDAVDIVAVSELLQDTRFDNPLGSPRPGQLLRLGVHSTLPRAVSWGPEGSPALSLWQPNVGIPLPTMTSGGDIDDRWFFEFSSSRGVWVLWYNSQLLREMGPTGVTPGTYACPTNLQVASDGRILTVTDGPCGGGGGGPGGGAAAAAGQDGAVQFALASVLSADNNLLYGRGSHTLHTPNLRTTRGLSNYEFVDGRGHRVFLVTPPLTADRLAQWPDASGWLMLLGSGSGIPRGAPGGGFVASELSGDCTTSGSNTVTCTKINGVTVSGTPGNMAVYGAGGITLVDGGPPGAGSTVLTAAAVLTTGNLVQAAGNDRTTVDSGVAANQVATLTGTQTLTNKRVPPRIGPLSSSATNPTFTCAWLDQCAITHTGAAGTLTMANPSGTPTDGEMMLVRFQCSALQTLTWGSNFIASTNVPLPTQCPVTTALEFHIGLIYISSLGKFQVMASD